MNIFEKRPLCLILCITLCGFLFFTFNNTVLRIAIIVIAILLTVLSLFLNKDKQGRLMMRLAAVALLIGSLASFLYFDLYFKAYDIYDGEVARRKDLSSYH